MLCASHVFFAFYDSPPILLENSSKMYSNHCMLEFIVSDNSTAEAGVLETSWYRHQCRWIVLLGSSPAMVCVAE